MTVLTIALSAILGWLLIWSGVVSMIGWMGWKPLAAAYPAQDEPEGQRFTWQGIYIGASSYNGVVTIVVSDEGIYLTPVRLFAYNHPPILIPWDAIQAVEPGLFGRVKLRLDNGRTISMKGRAGKAVLTYLDRLDAGELNAVNEPLLSLDDEPEASEEPERRDSWRRLRDRS